ncbi:MAG: uroporphyrinogen decarboxylase family protein [Acidobacteriota bacterium]|nr:uroporphyrinogen decarboxylase family protein [Acidobacteriota bacterium]
MNSKERVRAVLAGVIPDRVPFGEFAVDFDTVEKVIGHETYYRAKARSQIAFWEGRRDEVVQSWKEDGIAFFKKMDCFDIINIGAMASSLAPPRGFSPEKPARIDAETWRFKDGRVYKYSSVTADLTLVADPNVGRRPRRPAEFDREPEIRPPDPSEFEVVDAFIAAFGGSRYLAGPSGGEVGMHLLEGGESGEAFAHGLMQYILNPETVKAAIHHEVEKNNRLDRFYIRKGQDAVIWGQDFASSQGPFISPALFREFVLPGIKRRVGNIHSEFGLPVLKHACGNNRLLLDMFVEAGYDAYQSIQKSAGMDLAAVKRDYGRSLVCWGGLPVELLVSGTAGDVRKEVADAMESCKPGGRYIFGSTHSIAVGSRYDNVMAMIDEFEKRRDYRR